MVRAITSFDLFSILPRIKCLISSPLLNCPLIIALITSFLIFGSCEIISFICLVAFQLIPFPDFLINIISPNTKKIIDIYTSNISEAFKFKTISLNPWVTKGALVNLLTYAMTYFLVANNFNGKGRKNRLILSIVTVGSVEAFYGIIQYVSGEKLINHFSFILFGNVNRVKRDTNFFCYCGCICFFLLPRTGKFFGSCPT